MAEKLSESPPSALLVFCNAPDSKTADDIAQTLVAQRAAACVNILPNCRSVYRWEGKTESGVETPLLIKTTPARLPAVMETIRRLHPFEVPEIIAVPVVAGLPAYLSWIREQCD